MVGLIDSITISCHNCEIEKTKNFYITPLTDVEFERFKARDNRICPYCKAPMEYTPHRISEIAFQDKAVETTAAADTAAKPSKAELVLSMIEENHSQLFTDEYDVPYAAIKVNEHIEVLSIRSRRFRNWISRTVYKEASMVVDSQTIKDVIGVLSAKAEFDGEHKQLNLRVASLDGKWYYDLTNGKWEFVEITENGFKIVNSLVLFRRYGQQPQVYPSTEYAPDIFDKFMNLLNIKGEENRLLLKVYIVSMFIPGVPKVILMLHGEQGSAKTTLEELIRMLVDPSIVKTLAFPKDINEFIQQLAHNYVAFYDNISVIRIGCQIFCAGR